MPEAGVAEADPTAARAVELFVSLLGCAAGILALVANAIAERDVKEIYISDYDGANQKRVTVTRKQNIFPRWAPDARAIAYTSYRRDFPDVFISLSIPSWPGERMG